MVDPSVDRERRLEWFRKAKLGMFVHWGCYSVLGRGEQILNRDMMPFDEYAPVADEFKPDPEWAPRLARQAKEMGAKYVALTTRHHDGYCLFDTATHDFNAVKTGPGRDLIKEFTDAVRAEGMKVGLYYSVHTWRWHGFWDPEGYPDELPKMVDEMHAQLEELMTNYGEISVLWYDCSHVPGSSPPGSSGYQQNRIDVDNAEFWRSAEINARIRELQPRILINNRSGLPEDFGTPEQSIKLEEGQENRAWELCQTLNYAPNWGYLHASQADKSFGEVVYNMISAVRLGGNFLFNVGPDGQGHIVGNQLAVLKQLGRWMQAYGEAVYDTAPTGIYEEPGQGASYHYGMLTCSGSTAYMTLFYYPPDPLVISRIGPGIRSARMLATGEELSVEPMRNARWKISGLPAEPPKPAPPVMKIEFDGPPHLLKYSGAKWLDGEYKA